LAAPVGFLEHAVSENIDAGNAMNRRALYMYGAVLERGPAGQLGAGLGLTNSTGSIGLLPPTLDITHTGQQETLDGVRLVFQLTAGTEAPVEMNFLFPDRGRCAWPRTPPTTCTTCAGRWCAIPGSGPGT
jgi:alkyl sulfatase BDS1-like metallo-beta-lactamase superfamily hydrolase